MFLYMYCLDIRSFFVDSHQPDTGLAYTQNLDRLNKKDITCALTTSYLPQVGICPCKHAPGLDPAKKKILRK